MIVESPGESFPAGPVTSTSIALCKEASHLREETNIQAVIRISPLNPAGPMLDARGRILHCVFYIPNNSRALYRLPGMVPTGSPPEQPSYGTTIEADQGSFFLPRETSLWFVGGVVRDRYDVEIIMSRVLRLATTEFWLTSTTVGGGAIVIPENHVYIRLIAGSLVVNGVPVTATPYLIPTNSAITAGPNTVYQTGVIF